jgi:hypothetical protein
MDRTVGEVIDLLDAEIAVVRGIQLAIFGEASLSHIEAFPLTELCEAHIARLERIRTLASGEATGGSSLGPSLAGGGSGAQKS